MKIKQSNNANMTSPTLVDSKIKYIMQIISRKIFQNNYSKSLKSTNTLKEPKEIVKVLGMR
jgi:hypothetical protein